MGQNYYRTAAPSASLRSVLVSLLRRLVLFLAAACWAGAQQTKSFHMVNWTVRRLSYAEVYGVRR
jgi:hypothetical protein